MQARKPAVGLVGLGSAGMALATALLKSFEVIGHDRSPARAAVARNSSVIVVGSAGEVARRCEIVLLSLPTPDASRSAMEEMTGVGLAGRLIVETGTVGPHDVERLALAAAERGASVVDSAIVGGVHKLAEGKTTFLVGASDGDYLRVLPVLEAAAEEVIHLGPAGSGMRAKLVNNAVAHTTMVMLIEAAALAAKAGVPMDVFYKLMIRDSGLTRPLTHRFGERIRNQDFDGGMSTANALKDSALALDLAREMGVPLFVIQASHAVYEIACREGLGTLDYSAVSKLWERWVNTSLGGGTGD